MHHSKQHMAPDELIAVLDDDDVHIVTQHRNQPFGFGADQAPDFRHRQHPRRQMTCSAMASISHVIVFGVFDVYATATVRSEFALARTSTDPL